MLRISGGRSRSDSAGPRPRRAKRGPSRRLVEQAAIDWAWQVEVRYRVGDTRAFTFNCPLAAAASASAPRRFRAFLADICYFSCMTAPRFKVGELVQVHGVSSLDAADAFRDVILRNRVVGIHEVAAVLPRGRSETQYRRRRGSGSPKQVVRESRLPPHRPYIAAARIEERPLQGWCHGP
jgi:hypothetical protein